MRHPRKSRSRSTTKSNSINSNKIPSIHDKCFKTRKKVAYGSFESTREGSWTRWRSAHQCAGTTAGWYHGQLTALFVVWYKTCRNYLVYILICLVQLRAGRLSILLKLLKLNSGGGQPVLPTNVLFCCVLRATRILDPRQGIPWLAYGNSSKLWTAHSIKAHFHRIIKET